MGSTRHGWGYGQSRRLSPRRSRSRSRRRRSRSRRAARNALNYRRRSPSESSSEEDDEESSSRASSASTSLQPRTVCKEEAKHFAWREGEVIEGRYEVIKLLGDGTFGRVLLAKDRERKETVAVKVIRNVEKYTKSAKREVEILKDINGASEAVSCVRMFESFSHDSRLGRFFCMTFEVLGKSLYDQLKQNRFQGFWMQDIQSIARQCLEALSFLHGKLSLTHTDLKLENVLFASTQAPKAAEFPRRALWQAAQQRSSGSGAAPAYFRPASAEVKLIDFGNATYELEHHSSTINTRQYRAPEVILALGWNERSDLWSMGCILMELYTGELLFKTHDSLEHLVLMEESVELFPNAMLKRVNSAKQKELLCEAKGQQRWKVRREGAGCEARAARQQSLGRLVLPPHRSLAELASSLLILEPSRRPSAQAALAHPFLFERFAD